MAKRSAWVEVFSGVAAFALAILTWASWLFAPIFPDIVRFCSHTCPQFRFISLIEIPSDWNSFIYAYPSIVALIVAFLVASGVVALGACLHGRWRIEAGRWLLWSGSLLLPLLVSAMLVSPRLDTWVYFWPMVGVAVAYGPHAPLFQLLFPLGPHFGLSLLIQGVGPGLCAVMAIIASVAAARVERGGGRAGEGNTPVRPMARRRWMEWVEVLAGVGAFTLALLTWALWLFAPVYQLQRDGCTGLADPCIYSISPFKSPSDLDSFIRYFFIIAALIVAFLVASGAAALGAYLHGGRHVRAGRWLLWGGSLPLPLLVSVIYVLSLLDFRPVFVDTLGSATSVFGLAGPLTGQTIQFAFPPFFVPDLGKLAMVWGPVLCAVMALIASAAACGVEHGGRAEEESALAAPAASSGRIARVEVLAGVGAFTLALLTWALWLFAPVHRVYHQDCGITGQCNLYISLVEGIGGPDNFISYLPSFAALILAFLVAAGAVALGACLHGRWRARAGQWLLWGGSLPLPLLVSVISALPLERFIPQGPDSPFPKLYGGIGVFMAPGPDMLVLGWGLGLCAGLAVIAMIAMAARSDSVSRAGSRAR